MKKKQNYTVAEAQKKLEYYCAYQDRCHVEVIAKLKEMRMIPEAIDKIVADLIRANYLNETRFSKSFARGKFRIKNYGKLRIIRELKYRNISKYNIEIALNEINEEEYQGIAIKLIEKKAASIDEENPIKERKKIIEYMLRKGYELDLIQEIIHKRLT